MNIFYRTHIKGCHFTFRLCEEIIEQECGVGVVKCLEQVRV